MAMRRPRIKASANLVNIKRKKLEIEPKKTEDEPSKQDFVLQSTQTENESKHSIKVNTSISESLKNSSNNTQTPLDGIAVPITQKLYENTPIDITDVLSNSTVEQIVFDSAFKEPLKVMSNDTTSTTLSDEILNKDLKDNANIDIYTTYSGVNLSPNKQHIRQRIRPSPYMGQRRNSFVAASPSPHTIDSGSDFILPSPRREKPALLTNLGFNQLNNHTRSRTESACSNVSEQIPVALNPTKTTTTTTKTRRQSNNDHFVKLQWRRDYESRCDNGIPDKTRLKMLDLLFYNPANNPMEISFKQSHTQSKSHKTNVKREEESSKCLEENEMKSMNVVVPQLKLNSENELVLDDKSLVIETTAEHEARKILANTSLVFVDENTGMNGFYKKQKRTREWPHEETMKFYRCLQTIGTDFSLIQQLFPNRTRRELKLKFKKEERINGGLINKALLHPKKFNIAELETQLQTEERKQNEEDKKWKDIQKKDALKLIQDKKNTKSAATRTLSCGSLVYENEDVLQKKVASRTIITNYVINENATELVTPETKQALKSHVEKAIATRILKSSSNGVQEQTSKSEQRGNKYKENTISSKGTSLRISEKIKKENSKQSLENANLCRENSEISSNTSSYADNITIDNLDYKTKILVDMDNGEAIQIYEDDCNGDEEENYTLNCLNSTIKCDIEETPDIEIVKSLDNIQENNDQQEQTIEKILEQIEDGGLMLVSSIDPENTDNVLHEIYMIDKISKDLCDKPLDLPEDILQAVIQLVS